MASNTAPAEAGHNTGFGSRGYRAYVLGALLLAYIFNFIDRIMIAILAEPIIREFGLRDWQYGLLSGFGFALFYTLLGIPIARLSERVSRVWIIGIAILLWSAATAACGFAGGFITLLAFRFLVGVGEAGLTPPANSLIADYFVPRSRMQALAIYAMGITIGQILANLFVGLAGYTLGWREIFIAIGIAGVPLGLLILFTVREPPRGFTDPPGARHAGKAGLGETLRQLAGKATFWHVTAGSTLGSFVGYGVGSFVLPFLSRSHTIPYQEAALKYGVLLNTVAAFGTWLAGYLIERFSPRRAHIPLWLPALGFTCASAAYIAAFNAPGVDLVLPLLVVANLFHFFYLGPMYAVSQGVVDARARATAIAILLFIVNLIGYGLGPLFVGALSDLFAAQALPADSGLTLGLCKSAAATLDAGQAASCKSASADGLRLAITVTLTIFLWAAAHFLLAARTYRKDTVTA